MWVRNAQILNGFANSFFTIDWSIQGSAKRRSPGLVNFVAAVAYHFCLALPVAITQPSARLLADALYLADTMTMIQTGGED